MQKFSSFYYNITEKFQVHEGRYLCIYGSQNLDWIREFNSRMKEITDSGLQVEMVYVGKRKPTEHDRNILATIDLEKLSGSLSLTKTHLFWLRLETMRRSALRLGKMANTDYILEEVAALLNMDEENDQGWAVMGSGSSLEIVRLKGERVMDCLILFSKWGPSVGKLGLLGAIRSVFEPPVPAGHRCQSHIMPFSEGLMEHTMVCNECKRPLEKYVLYKCETKE